MIVISPHSGEVIAQAIFSIARFISVSTTGNVIYLAASESKVYQSTDDGVTWSRILLTATENGWMVTKAVKVLMSLSDKTTDVAWTVEAESGYAKTT